MATDNRKQERFWNQLLGIVSRETIVPVVGEGLLTLPESPGHSLLFDELARRFADACNIKLDPTQHASLSAVVRGHPDFGANPHDVYLSLGEEFESWNPPIPPPLRELARIRHFNFFVSTTFDDLLERALNEERFGGKKLTDVIAYSPKNVPDDMRVAERLASGRPVIFQLFGKYTNPLQYALTEGDKVEYMHALQTADYRPSRVFAELYDRPLLMLGNCFPDWLTRMFLRMIRRTALDNRDIPKQYVSETPIAADPTLRFFLRNFATNTELIEDLDSIEFVSELRRRWQERFGTAAGPVDVQEPKTSLKPMPRNAVFISYCATDASGKTADDSGAALAIRDALEARGIDVWLDKDQLRGGDEFERRIERYVSTCSLFMPLISRTTESREDGFFRKEWSWALSRLPNFTGSDRQFLFPVLVDNIDPYRAKVPDEFKRYQFSPLSAGRPDSAFVDRVQSLYEKARSVN